MERVGYHITRHLNKLWIKRTFAEACKRFGHVPPTLRLPLTTSILVRLRPCFNFTLHDHRALWAIICVGVFTLARIGELVPSSSSELKVSLANLSLRGDKGSLFLVGTKTDRERKGTTLFFFLNNSLCCPVTAMTAYLAGRQSRNRDSPLFVDAHNHSISQAWVISHLRKFLDDIGLEGKTFSGISLRRGGAQSLVRRGANDIMGMGRWTSS